MGKDHRARCGSRCRSLMLRLMERMLLVLVATVAACATEGTGPVPDAESQAQISAAIDGQFAEYTGGVSPGAAVMVVRDGEIVHAKGYGLADLEQGLPLEPDTSIRLGSVSKQFTCMAIMILAEQGRLDYDDHATRYIPELAARYGDSITVRHLMTHTSGLPGYYSALEEASGDVMPRNEQGAELYAIWGEPVFKPGERYEYSNPAYEMLALIVERVSNRSFREFTSAHIFEPLGMNDSVALEPYDTSPKLDKRAYGYSRTDDGGFELNEEHVLNNLMGSGGIYTTLEDMYRWDQALYTDVLVSEETLQQAFTKATLKSGEAIDYGFGWRLDEQAGHRRIGHGGSWVGFRTAILRFPEESLTVVVLSNLAQANPSTAAETIADLYLES